jgi:hypothetical protein
MTKIKKPNSINNVEKEIAEIKNYTSLKPDFSTKENFISRLGEKRISPAILKILLAAILAVVFLLLTLPFMTQVPPDKLGTQEGFEIGGGNMWRIVFIFGFLTSITFYITFHKNLYRLTALLLGFCWVLGTAGVIIINSQNCVNCNSSTASCTKSTPYPRAPEFERAISLIEQRWQQRGGSFYVQPGIKNCLDIQYKDLSGLDTEGYFVFDPSSTVNDLKIYVDNSYQNNDDLLTAVLLAHEIQHANQFFQFKTYGQQQSCFDQEVDAFTQETTFIDTLNDQEKNSILARLNSRSEGMLVQTVRLFQVISDSELTCGSLYVPSSALGSINAGYTTCVQTDLKAKIAKLVTSDPGYQQQCAGR